MVEENNTPESPYPGPAEPGSKEEVYPDIEGEQAKAQTSSETDSEIEAPEDGPVDDAEEPSPGNTA